VGAPVPAAFAERRGGGDDEDEITQAGRNCRGGVAEERHGAGAAIAAGERNRRCDAEYCRHFLRPKRL